MVGCLSSCTCWLIKPAQDLGRPVAVFSGQRQTFYPWLLISIEDHARRISGPPKARLNLDTHQTNGQHHQKWMRSYSAEHLCRITQVMRHCLPSYPRRCWGPLCHKDFLRIADSLVAYYTNAETGLSSSWALPSWRVAPPMHAMNSGNFELLMDKAGTQHQINYPGRRPYSCEMKKIGIGSDESDSHDHKRQERATGFIRAGECNCEVSWANLFDSPDIRCLVHCGGCCELVSVPSNQWVRTRNIQSTSPSNMDNDHVLVYIAGAHKFIESGDGDKRPWSGGQETPIWTYTYMDDYGNPELEHACVSWHVTGKRGRHDAR
jgi:hypothetical protein